MTIRGDMEVMIARGVLGKSLSTTAATTPVVREILDWMTSGDVLRVMEHEEVDVREWIAGVEALRSKCL